MSGHPTPEELSGFLLGTLPIEKFDDLAGHLEACPSCQETIHNLEAHADTLLESLRRSQEPSPIDSACRQAMQKAVALVKGAAGDADSATESVSGPSEEIDTADLAVRSDASPDAVLLSAQAVTSGENPAAPSQALTVEQFVAQLKSAGIVADEDWSSLEAAIGAATDGDDLANRLVARGTLTSFQAQLVAQGKTRGLLLGEYIVLDRIGAGGMGQVYKARHRRMDRLVALKVMSTAAIKDAEAVKRFQREVKTAARLIHPNIVTAFDAGQQGNVHFLVMELVDGSDLSSRLRQHGPLPVRDAVQAVLQAARGLAFAHAAGVVHRDVKPANLLLDKHSVVRILDMGLARFDDPLGRGQDDGLTHSGQVMGTVDYMAPEQAFNTRDAGQAADVYGLGCTLYRLLTGQALYGGETVVQKILAHREQPIPALTAARPEVPVALGKLYERMVAKKAEDRPRMTEIVAELERLDKVTPSSDGSRGKKPPLKRIAAGAAGFLFLLLGIWVIVRDKDDNEVGRLKIPDEGSVTIHTTDGYLKKVVQQPLQPAEELPLAAPPIAKAPFDAAQAKAHQAAWAKHLGAPVETTNSIGMKMVLIPPGEFLMGATAAEIEVARRAEAKREVDAHHFAQIGKYDGPEHRVVLTRPYLIGATETTVGEFRRFIAATKYKTEAERFGGGDSPSMRPTDSVANARTWSMPGKVGDEPSPDEPVRQVTRNDAVVFCNWLSAEEGFEKCYVADEQGQWRMVDRSSGYSLPTEAEWEYACRAGTTTKYSFGDDEGLLEQHAWYAENSGDGVKTVGRKRPSPFGLYDMHGNVFELCYDWLLPDYYRGSPVNDPVQRTPASEFVARGGAYHTSAVWCRSAQRNHGQVSLRSHAHGFRVVRGIPPVDDEVTGKHIESKSTTTSTTTISTPLPPAKAPFDAAQAKVHQAAWAKHLGTEVETVNSVGAKMVLIPPGEFLMGSSDEQVAAALSVAEETQADQVTKDRIQRAERPQHRVVITKPFLMGATEVTIGQFNSFVEASKYVTEAEQYGFGDSSEKVPTDKTTEAQKQHNWRAPGYAVTDVWPVAQITWNDAVAYCNWLSAKEKVTYRLPTEAEWEYACRAGTMTQYSFGDDHRQLDQFDRHQKDGADHPHAVAIGLPNGFGLFDMHGNLCEWCQDYWNEKVYEQNATVDPIAADSGVNRVFRGGASGSRASHRRSAFRHNFPPSYRLSHNGFRIVRELAAQPTPLLAATSTTPGIPPTNLASSPQPAWTPGPSENVLPGLIPRPTIFKGLKRWNLDTVAPQGNIWAVAWSADGRRLAVSSNDLIVRIYQVSADAKFVLSAHFACSTSDYVDSLAWSPDGQSLACSTTIDGKRIVQARDSVSGNLLKTLNGATLAGGWSRDGRRFLAANDRHEVVVWTLPEWAVERTYPGMTGFIRGLAWSPDEQSLAVVSADKQCRVWGVDGSKIAEFRLQSPPTTAPGCLSWRRDGKQIAVGASDSYELFSLDAPNSPQVFKTANPHLAFFNPKFDELVVSQVSGKVFSADLASAKSTTLAAMFPFGCAAWSPDGRWLACGGGNGSLEFWDREAKSITKVYAHKGFHRSQWLAEGSLLSAACNDGTVRLWGSNGEPRGMTMRARELSQYYSSDYAVSPDGSQLIYFPGANAASDRQVIVQQVLTGEQRILDVGMRSPRYFAFSPDGKHAAWIAADDRIQVFNATSWNEEHDFVVPRDGSAKALVWSAASDSLFTVGGGKIHKYRFGDKQPRLVMEDMRFEPTKFWSCSRQDSKDRILMTAGSVSMLVDLATPRVLWSRPSNNSGISDLSLDGRFAVDVHNRDLLLVDADTGRDSRRRALMNRNLTTFLSWNPDGSWISESHGDSLLLLDPATLAPQRVIVYLDEKRSATFSAAGELLFSEPAVDEHLVYIVERDDGRTELLSPPKFRRQFLDGAASAPSVLAATSTPPLAKAPFDAAQAKAHQAAWAKHLGIEVATTNSVGAKMVLIPPGEFLMGSSDEQVEAALKVADEIKANQSAKEQIQKSERPQHKVVITRPFLMSATEVTIGQFKQFVADAKHVTEAEQYGCGNSASTIVEAAPERTNSVRWNAPEHVPGDDSAVTQVSWNDACAYCNWRSANEQLRAYYRLDARGRWAIVPDADGYRLPTEAEWEFACRAGSETQYGCGDEVLPLNDYGWSNANARDNERRIVGRLHPNAFGLFDMHGNLMEWCQDCLDPNWYAKSPTNDPLAPDPLASQPQTFSSWRVLRGGSWYDSPTYSRSAFRFSGAPSYRHRTIGFRVVRTLSAAVFIANLKHANPGKEVTSATRPPARAPLPVVVTPAAKVGRLPGPRKDILPGLISRPALLPKVRRWNIETIAPRGNIDSVAWTADGRRLAVASQDANVRIYDVGDNSHLELVGRLGFLPLEFARTLAWHPDGRQLAYSIYGSGRQEAAEVRDAETGELLRKLPDVWFLGGWTRDGRRFLTVNGRFEIQLWKLPEWTVERTITGLKGRVHGLAWSPDETRFAAYSEDKTCRVWTRDGTVVAKIDLPAAPAFNNHNGLSWRRDGRQLAVGLAGAYVLCDLTEPPATRVVVTGGLPCFCAFSPRTDELVVSQNGSPIVLGEPTKGKMTPLPNVEPSPRRCAAWSPDGNLLAIGNEQGKLWLWNHRTQSMTPVFQKQNFYSPRWINGGKEFIAVTQHLSVRTWSAEGEQLRVASLDAPSNAGTRWTVSPDGRWVVYHYSSPDADQAVQIHVLDAVAGDTRKITAAGKTTGNTAFSPDGKYVALLLAGNRLQVFSTTTWQSLWDRPLPGDRLRTALVWSRDSSKLWAVGGAGMVGLSLAAPEQRVVFDDPRLAPVNQNDVASAGAVDRVLVRRTDNDRTLSLVDLRSPGIVWSHPWVNGTPALNSQGTLLAGGEGSSVVLREGATDKILVRRLSEPSVNGCDWSPDDRLLLKSDNLGTLRVIDAETFEPRRTIVYLDDRRSATFSESGDLLFPEPFVDRTLVYIVEDDDGVTTLLSPSEFRERFDKD